MTRAASSQIRGPESGHPIPPLTEAESRRFWAKVDQGHPDECWEWQASTNGGGYGQFKCGGTVRIAHRVAYSELVGPLPQGLCLDHLCRNRICVNPAHLDAVTGAENVRRGVPSPQQLATHCHRGHPFDADNTYVRPDNGCRVCRACRRLAGRKYDWKTMRNRRAPTDPSR